MGLVTPSKPKLVKPQVIDLTPDKNETWGLPDYILDLDVFLVFDYSQAEIRMLAEISGDPLLISQLNMPNADIHSLIGSQLTGWPPERIKKEKNLRKMVKNMVFGIIYGIGRENLYDYVVGKIRAIDGENADLSGITKEKLVKLYDKFFRVYAGVKRFIDEYRALAQDQGWVPTMFGFNREIKENDETRGTYWLNQAVNSPIQGSAHQLVLIAIALIHMKPKTYSLLQRPCMEVHDAMYFFTKVRHLIQTYQQANELLTHGVIEYAKKYFGVTIRVPFLAEAGVGFCLGSLVDYEGETPNKMLIAWREKHKKVETEGWEKLLKTADYELSDSV